jgi:hypothetical protein
MRTRRIVWLLAVLLTAFAVPSTPGVRVVNFAEVQRVETLYRKEQRAVEQPAPRVFPAGRNVVLYSSREPRVSLWLSSYFRFQRPPPFTLSA